MSDAASPPRGRRGRKRRSSGEPPPSDQAAAEDRRTRGSPRWLAPVAIASCLLLAYAFYYLNHLPQARAIAAGTEWKVAPGEQLRLHGVGEGSLLHLNFSREASVKMRFDAGATLAPDEFAGHDGHDGRTPLDLALFNRPGENAEIRLAVAPDGEGRQATVAIEPRRPDPRLLALTVRSDAPLRIEAAVVAVSERPEHGQILFGDLPLEEAALVVPPGSAFTLTLRADQLEGLRKEVGEYIDDGQRLGLSAVEIGTELEGAFERRQLACGARSEAVLWQRAIPGLGTRDCRGGRLYLTGLDVGGGATAALRGAGYVVEDGETETWQGFREFWQNDVVKALMGPLLAGFAAWVLYILRDIPAIRAVRRSFGRSRS